MKKFICDRCEEEYEYVDQSYDHVFSQEDSYVEESGDYCEDCTKYYVDRLYELFYKREEGDCKKPIIHPANLTVDGLLNMFKDNPPMPELEPSPEEGKIKKFAIANDCGEVEEKWCVCENGLWRPLGDDEDEAETKFRSDDVMTWGNTEHWCVSGIDYARRLAALCKTEPEPKPGDVEKRLVNLGDGRFEEKWHIYKNGEWKTDKIFDERDLGCGLGSESVIVPPLYGFDHKDITEIPEHKHVDFTDKGEWDISDEWRGLQEIPNPKSLIIINTDEYKESIILNNFAGYTIDKEDMMLRIHRIFDGDDVFDNIKLLSKTTRAHILCGYAVNDPNDIMIQALERELKAGLAGGSDIEIDISRFVDNRALRIDE